MNKRPITILAVPCAAALAVMTGALLYTCLLYTSDAADEL